MFESRSTNNFALISWDFKPVNNQRKQVILRLQLQELIVEIIFGVSFAKSPEILKTNVRSSMTSTFPLIKNVDRKIHCKRFLNKFIANQQEKEAPTDFTILKVKIERIKSQLENLKKSTCTNIIKYPSIYFFHLIKKSRIKSLKILSL